jgi:ATP citrate (pro-S)-lyase
VVGGGIANFTDVAATFSGIIRAFREKVSPMIYLYIKVIVVDEFFQLYG